MTHPQVATVAALSEQLAALTAGSPLGVAGFVPRRRYRRVACDWLDAEEGHEPFWAELVCSLTPDEVDSIPIGDGVTLLETWQGIARYVRAWNALAFDSQTGELRPVPPPAEIGPDAFRVVDSVIGPWIAITLKRIYLGIGDSDRPKGSTPPASTDATPNDGGSA